jgi:hypothetical protein
VRKEEQLKKQPDIFFAQWLYSDFCPGPKEVRIQVVTIRNIRQEHVYTATMIID